MIIVWCSNVMINWWIMDMFSRLTLTSDRRICHAEIKIY